MTKWTQEDSVNALQQGWDIFRLDDGSLMIQALDDPIGVAAEQGKEFQGKIFEGYDRDDEAICHVKGEATGGDKTCIKALKFLAQQQEARKI